MHEIQLWCAAHPRKTALLLVGAFAMGVVILAIALIGILSLMGFSSSPGSHPQPSPTPTTTVLPTPSLTATPTPTSTPIADAISQQIAAMTTEQKIGALLMLHTSGTNQAALIDFVQHYHPGGLILMGDNIPANVSDLSQLTTSLKQLNADFPLLIATDEEGCSVKRLPWDTFACPQQLGMQPVAETQAAFNQRGQLLHQAGITVDFGVVADVTDDPNSFIYPRVFSGDPTAAADRVAAAVKGLLPWTAATLKHFPGHGETEDNSHTTVPNVTVNKELWEQHDKPSFAAGIGAGAQVVMMGQLTYTAIDQQPATLSATWHDILRQELGFKGVIVTDAMGMLQNSGEAQFQDPVQNAIQAINAGNDLILFVSNYDTQNNPGNKVDLDGLISGLKTAVKNGQISEATLDQALTHTLWLRQTLRGL